MRSVPYSIERGAVTTWLPARKKPSLSASAAVLELHAPVLPRITDAIWIAERFRGRLMRYFENRKPPIPIPPLVHGKGEDGLPSRDHSQLFILPQANKLGRIDSLYVFTRHPHGFDTDVRDAITAVKGLAWMDEIRVTPVWVGSAADRTFRPGKQVVASATPFVTVRHWRKGRGTMDEFLEREVVRECRHHGLPRPRRIEPIEFVGGINPVKFRKYRDGDPSRKGYGFRLEFDEPVPAPFSLGYACHFGLGQFKPEP
jgi:CRISPR-associated protein Csb2